MSFRDRLLAGAAAAPYAHLLTGRKPSAAAKKAEDDDDKKDDDKREDARAEDEEEDKKEDDEKREAKKSKGKVEGDDEECAEDEKDDDDEKDDEKARAKARYAGHGLALSVARRQTRAAMLRRFATIFGSAAAAQRPDMAASLFCQLDLSAKDAASLLKASAAGSIAAPTLSERMKDTKQPALGADGRPAADKGSVGDVASAMVAAYDKHSGAAKPPAAR